MIAATPPRRFPNSFPGSVLPAPAMSGSPAAQSFRYLVISLPLCFLVANSLKSSCPIPLFSSRWIASVNLLESSLANSLASVKNKGLTEILTPLESTLTKNRGEGVVIVNQVPVHQDRSKGITGTFRPSRKKPSLPLASLGVSNFRVEGSTKRLASF